MMKDSTPSLVCCGDAALRDGIVQSWKDAPAQFLFDEFSRCGWSATGADAGWEADAVTLFIRPVLRARPREWC